MKSYEEAVYTVAEQYAHEAHDSMFARVNADKVAMIAFIFDKDSGDVSKDVMGTFVDNREVFWR